MLLPDTFNRKRYTSICQASNLTSVYDMCKLCEIVSIMALAWIHPFSFRGFFFLLLRVRLVCFLPRPTLLWTGWLVGS